MKNIEQLIVMFVTNQASQEDIEILTQYLQSDENKILFKDFVKINYAIDITMNKFDSLETKKYLFEVIKKEKTISLKSKIKSYYKYAAILIIALSGFYFYQKLSTVVVTNNNEIVPKELAIVLEVENESAQDIDITSSQKLTDKLGNVIGKQNKNKLVYLNSHNNGKLIYNTLKIPYGKTFEVQLSDGTIAHLNAGSSLRFPSQFSGKGNRQVYLTGEAFFEVSKDKAHPFIVNTTEMKVEVLGTKFNVNSYKEDNSTNVVLVEGKVSLYKGLKIAKKQVYLTPGMKGCSVNGQDKIAKEEVNTDYYTDWLKGNLVFKNASFDDIIIRLERRYSVTFINKNKVLGKEVFNARFDNEPIETVLKYFSDSYAINYEINKDIIVIK